MLYSRNPETVVKNSSPTRSRTVSWLAHWGPVIVYAAAIFTQSGHSGPDLPAIPFADKVAHAAIYALLCVLVYRAMRNHRLGRHPIRCAVVSIVLTALYGLSDEWHQSMVPERQAEALDALANLAGAIGGAWVALRVWPSPPTGTPHRLH